MYPYTKRCTPSPPKVDFTSTRDALPRRHSRTNPRRFINSAFNVPNENLALKRYRWTAGFFFETKQKCLRISIHHLLKSEKTNNMHIVICGVKKQPETKTCRFHNLEWTRGEFQAGYRQKKQQNKKRNDDVYQTLRKKAAFLKATVAFNVTRERGGRAAKPSAWSSTTTTIARQRVFPLKGP